MKAYSALRMVAKKARLVLWMVAMWALLRVVAKAVDSDALAAVEWDYPMAASLVYLGAVNLAH